MNDSELLNIFWAEVTEYLESLNAQLLQVEMAPANDQDGSYVETIREMNRIAHSMKGAARAVGITVIETLAHYMEEILGAVAGKRLVLSPDVADTLYDVLDLIDSLAHGRNAEPTDDETPQEPIISEQVLSQVLAKLEALVSKATPAKLSTDTQEVKPVFLDQTYSDHLDNIELQTGEFPPEAQLSEAQVSDEGPSTPEASDITSEVSEVPFEANDDSTQEASPFRTPLQTDQQLMVPNPLHDENAYLEEQPKVTAKPPAHILNTATMTALTEANTMVLRQPEESVRVTVSKLDKLMAEVTELFVARMHNEEQQRSIAELRRMHTRWQREWRGVRAAYIRLVRRLQEQGEDQDDDAELPVLFRFLENNQRYLNDANRHLMQLAQTIAQDNMRLSTLADQLQDDISEMRLMPFEMLTGGFQRMIRDLARDTQKQVNMEVIGGTVEIDKAVLDELKDPIMHVLRNAVDHGIEPPEQRRRAGKGPTGRISVDVQQRGSEIIIHIIDDGRGIDANRVRRSIVRNKLMSEAQANALSDDEARGYIFQAGLSTNEEVTSLSGRGIGMDIVRDRVESLRGRVGLKSTVGYGTTITISVPVSLTRLRCIMLRIGKQQYAVPATMVMRMDKISREEVFTAEGRDMVMIGERPLPLVSMGSVLEIQSEALQSDRLSYVALQATDRAIVFEVDEVFSEEELVLKPLGAELARAKFVSGASLLGSGEVVIVLDVNDLVREATGLNLPRRSVTPAVTFAPVARRLSVLVVDDSITTRTLEKNILETAGFDVTVAIDGVEAWALLPQYEFDVIISDVEMPNMNGLELTQRIKSSDVYEHIPVILLTSLSKPEQREAGLRAGANAYLVKSRFDQSELLDAIFAVV